MPTILDILNVSYAGSMEGNSLLPLIRGEEGLEFCNDIFVEEDYNKYLLKGIIRNNEWKLIWTGKKSALRNVEKEGQIELYNLKEDPNELRNLTTLEPKILKSMLDKLNFFITDCQKKAINPVETKLDRETVEQLRSLGYLQ